MRLSDQGNASILRLWREGKDTNEIARSLNYREHEVANALPYLRGEDMKTWTPEMDEELKSHYVAGLSGSQIAAEMRRGLSRNAVLGRIHRTGLNGNTQRERQPTTREGREQKRLEREGRKNERRRAQRLRFRIENPRPNPEEIKIRCAAVEPRHVGLVDLEPGDCRYPYGDSPFTFCGHPQMQGSYCAAHFFLTVGGGTPSERAASRVTPRHLEAAE